MQLINVALGGTLYQDIPSMLQTKIVHGQTQEKQLSSHEIFLTANAPLSKLINKSCIQVNSIHHQAVACLADALAPMAYAQDGLIEAYYAPNKTYLRAYQWHPERLIDQDEDNALIFIDFIQACQAGKIGTQKGDCHE